MAKKKTFEQSLLRLEEIISEMERNEIPLDESVTLYKEAIGLAAFCGDNLNKIEAEVCELKKIAEGIFSEEKFS